MRHHTEKSQLSDHAHPIALGHAPYSFTETYTLLNKEVETHRYLGAVLLSRARGKHKIT
jgi:hypothetical protein